MKAEELRIGNLINQGQYGAVPVSGYEMHSFSLYCNGSSVSEYYKEWKPIPLTEEWVDKKTDFFEWKGWYYLKLKNIGEDFTLCFAPNENLLMLNIGEKTINYENPTVHLLQNIHYTLTGEELTIK